MTLGKLLVYGAEALQAVTWKIAPKSRFAVMSSRLYLRTFMRYWPWRQLLPPQK